MTYKNKEGAGGHPDATLNTTKIDTISVHSRQAGEHEDAAVVCESLHSNTSVDETGYGLTDCFLADAKIEGYTKKYYYDRHKMSYITKNKRGVYMPLTLRQLVRRLKNDGFSFKRRAGEKLSSGDNQILYIENCNDVDYCGSLAGHKSGLYEDGGRRLLITDSPILPAPAAGCCGDLLNFFLTLLGNEQMYYLCAWLKIAMGSLLVGCRRPGQVIAFIGKKGHGKSLAQNIITIMFGGRSAKPYPYMTGQTPFNADLFSAEHLMVEDEASSTDGRARRKLGSFIKNIVANEEQRLHGKGRDALMLKPFWRLTMSLNDELEDMMVLPIMDDAVLDKIMLFRTSQADIPLCASNAERTAFWDKLTSEIPAFIYWLLNEFVIEQPWRDNRYGIVAYHNPEIIMELDSLSPEIKLLQLIDASSLFNERCYGSSWEGTAEELETRLVADYSPVKSAIRKLLSWNNACGSYLGKLAKKRPARVRKHRTSTERKWIITPPQQ